MSRYSKGWMLILLIGSSYLPQATAQALSKTNIGLGVGIDYGGIGSRLTYRPIERIDFFGSLGYNFNSAGYNLGAHLRIPTQSRIDWFLSAMYGYNAVLTVKATSELKTTYYGPSAGAGIELKMGQNRKSFFSFEIIRPFRPDAMDDAIRDLKILGYSVDDPLPVAVSVGYHVKLK